MSNIAVAQNVVFVPTLATFNSSPVSGYVAGGAQIAYLGGQVTELDGGQGFYQARDNDFSSATSFPSVIADSTGLRWSLTSVVTQAQIVSALTAAGTLPGLDPLTTQGANIASATTTDLSAATGNYVNITGTTTITGLGTIAAGKLRFVTFTGILTLTHNATSLILPGGANITTAAGDAAIFVSLGSGNWKCIVYTEAAGGTPGTLSVPQGGTGQVSFTLGNILTGNGTSALGSFAPGTGVTTFLTTPSSANLAAAVTDETGSGALVFATSPTLVTPTLGVASATSLTLDTPLAVAQGGTGRTAAAPPSVQVFTTGSGTYNTPAGATAILVELVGGGGGGAGSGTAPAAATAGGNTTFGSLTASGGALGATANQTGAAGGTGTGGDLNVGGGPGGLATSGTNRDGAYGGGSFYGGGGPPGGGGAVVGNAAQAYGAGGGGAGTAGTGNSGGGGGAGGYLRKLIAAPAASYSYAVGAAGSAGGAGGSGAAGGAGASGAIVVTAYFG